MGDTSTASRAADFPICCPTCRELQVFRRENTPFGIAHSPMVQRSNTVQVGTALRGREPSLDSAPAAALSSLIRRRLSKNTALRSSR